MALTSPIPAQFVVPPDVAVVPDNFDLSTITPGDLIFAGASLLAAVVSSQLAKRALRRVLDGARTDR